METRQVKNTDDVDGFVTLTVRWEENAYTVKFDPYLPPIIPPIGEAEIKSQFLNQYTALYGKIVSPVNPVKFDTTHGFAGWYIEGGDDTRWNFNLGVAENVTLYAKWDTDSHSVCFEANGGARTALTANSAAAAATQ